MIPAFFTRPSSAYSVPHDRIGVRWVLVAHLAVTRAFEMIREEGWSLKDRGENEITTKLESTLRNNIHNRGEVNGFDKNFFTLVTRGSEVVNFDGVKISKKPDLVFHLKRDDRIEWDQTQDALFAECKPVDKLHSLSGHYCAVGKDCTGIERFVIGDYAWAMEEALMIGYTRDGFSIFPHLANSLKDKKRNAKLGFPSEIGSIDTKNEAGTTTTVYHTTHQRTFVWRGSRNATPIVLYHSWHSCD